MERSRNARIEHGHCTWQSTWIKMWRKPTKFEMRVHNTQLAKTLAPPTTEWIRLDRGSLGRLHLECPTSLSQLYSLSALILLLLLIGHAHKTNTQTLRLCLVVHQTNLSSRHCRFNALTLEARVLILTFFFRPVVAGAWLVDSTKPASKQVSRQSKPHGDRETE